MTLEQVIEKLENSGIHEIVLAPNQLLGWLKELRDTRELEEKHWNECMQIAHYDDELKAADVQPISQWISVKDRLPEERKRVLVYNEGGITIAWRDKGEWDDIFLTVTHWQPLPEPPKDGDTE